MTVREGLGWIIGSAIAGIGAFLSWFYESGLFGTIISIVIGAGIAYFVQTRTQKRVWKREYALKNTEVIYGPLYENIDWALGSYDEAFQGFYIKKWNEIKKTFQYLTIDEALKKKMDDFFQKLDKYNHDVRMANQLIENVILKEYQTIFPSHGGLSPSFQIQSVRRNGIPISISESIRLKRHPLELAEKGRRQGEHEEYVIGLLDANAKQSQHLHYEGEVKADFDRMWNACHEKIERDPLIQSVRKEYPEIIKGLQDIKKELIKRIQEPWEI